MSNIQNIKTHVRLFLEHYPLPKDFWEVMNVKLVHSLLQKFPNITVLTSVIALKPDHSLSFPRESKVHYKKGSTILKESFKFTKLRYLICNESFQSLDLHVDFDYKDHAVPSDYPDYQWMDQAMEEFFAEHPIGLSQWSQLKPQLEAFLLKRFPSLTSIEVDVSISR